MSSHAGSEVNSAASSKAREPMASALKARVDLSLVAGSHGSVTSSSRAHSKSATPVTSSSRAHSKSATDANVVPSLSGAARAEALRLARLLASSHSD